MLLQVEGHCLATCVFDQLRPRLSDCTCYCCICDKWCDMRYISAGVYRRLCLVQALSGRSQLVQLTRLSLHVAFTISVQLWLRFCMQTCFNVSGCSIPAASNGFGQHLQQPMCYLCCMQPTMGMLSCSCSCCVTAWQNVASFGYISRVLQYAKMVLCWMYRLTASDQSLGRRLTMVICYSFVCCWLYLGRYAFSR